MCLLVPSVVPYFTIISAEAMRTWDRALSWTRSANALEKILIESQE